MSLDIMFQKGFPLEDVEKKTDIKVEERDGEFWLKKGENVILTKVKMVSYTD